MKTINSVKALWVITFFLIMTYSCKPDDDDLFSASFPINPNVFIDDFSAGLEYSAFGGSDVTGFDLDFEETYNGTEASMKFSVPDFNAAEGSFVGGVFFASGGRDLTGFTALTFYAKATRSANIDVIGFGVSPAGSALEDDFEVSVANLAVNTNWKKYYIPIPDPSKLNAEEALLYYAEGPENAEGYTFWLDEVQYENLGLLSQPKATMMGGQNVVQLAYQGVNVSIENVSYQVNLPNGVNQMYNLTINYFDLVSSNESVVQIGPNNEINVVGPGLALIRGFVNGVEAEGTLTLNVQGGFVPAPIPTYDAADVISLFSDTYPNVQVDFYNGFWEPFQTTESNDFAIGNDNILNYTNFNFVGTQFSNPTINASNMTHIHFDVFIPGAVQPGTNLNIILRDFGADGADGGSDDSNLSVDFTSTDLVQGAWNRLDIPLSTLTNTSNMGLIIYEGADLPNIFVDNIFFYN